MKKKIIRPTAEEDAVITKAALSDPDNPPITEEEWNEIKHRVVRGRGTKEQVTLRIDKDVSDY
jgi:uncharacterized protein (DUF4415 family)